MNSDHQGDPDAIGLTRGELEEILNQHGVGPDSPIDLEVWVLTDKPRINDLEERGGRVRVDLTEVSVEKVTGQGIDGYTVVKLMGRAHR